MEGEHGDSALTASAVLAWLIPRMAALLGAECDAIQPEDSLDTLGLSSRQVLELSGDLEEWIGRKVAPAVLWETASIGELASAIADEKSVPAPTPNLPARFPAIAIIGVACRLPGAPAPDAFWELLATGRSAVAPPPAARSSIQRPGGYVQDIDAFDAPFFRINPREAASMDPQQRLLLETAWHALEDAQIVPESLRESDTGVFAGASGNEYALLQAEQGLLPGAYTLAGAAFGAIANRVSHQFDLRGPSITIDTACASSITALHLACQSLHTGECGLAIVGGVNVLAAASPARAMQAAGLLSASGACRSFQERADGTVRGEGCVALVLKPLETVQRDGDAIRGVIRGTAIAHAGRASGFGAPVARGLGRAISRTVAGAGISPDRIGCVQAHGAGMPESDAAELSALAHTLSGAVGPCAVRTTKHALGNLEAASGLVSLLALLLSMEQEQIPPQPNDEDDSSRSQGTESRLQLSGAALDWRRGQALRAGLVTVTGITGAAGAVLLEEPVPAPPPQPVEHDTEVIILSAHSVAALRELAGAYAQDIETRQPRLADFAASANLHRARLAHRAAVAASSVAEAARLLREIESGVGNAGTEPAAGSAQRLCDAFLRGDPCDFVQWHGVQRRPLRLPGYPFQREHCWLEFTEATATVRVSETRSLATSPPQLAEINQFLREAAAELLRKPIEAIDPDCGLLALGLDSLMMMDIIARIGARFGTAVYPRELFDVPTLSQLGQLVLQRLTDSSADARFGAGLDFVQLQAASAVPVTLAQRMPHAVFLLSAPRSGSTLLRVMLAGHPRLFCPPELHLLPFSSMRERARHLHGTTLWEGLSHALVHLEGISLDAANETVRHWEEQDLPVTEVYRHLALKAAPRILVDKSPTNAGALHVLRRAEAYFDTPRYIHLVRHPVAAIESIVRMKFSTLFASDAGDEWANAESIWTHANANAAKFLEALPPGRKISVKYEDLVGAPERILPAVCEALGLDFDERVLRPYDAGRMTTLDSGVPTLGDPRFLLHRDIDAALADKWQEIDLPAPLRPLTHRVAESLGYALAGKGAGVPRHSVRELAPATQCSTHLVEERF